MLRDEQGATATPGGCADCKSRTMGRPTGRTGAVTVAGWQVRYDLRGLRPSATEGTAAIPAAATLVRAMRTARFEPLTWLRRFWPSAVCAPSTAAGAPPGPPSWT